MDKQNVLKPYAHFRVGDKIKVTSTQLDKAKYGILTLRPEVVDAFINSEYCIIWKVEYNTVDYGHTHQDRPLLYNDYIGVKFYDENDILIYRARGLHCGRFEPYYNDDPLYKCNLKKGEELNAE